MSSTGESGYDLMKSSFNNLWLWLNRWEWLLLLTISPLLLFPSAVRSPALLVAPLLLWARRFRGGSGSRSTPLDGALLLLTVMLLVSLYATYDIALSLPKIAGVVLGLGAYYVIVDRCQQPKSWFAGVGLFCLAGTAITGIALIGTNWFYAFSPLTPVLSRLPFQIRGLPGAEDGFNPNQVAGALVWMIPVLLAFTGLVAVRFRPPLMFAQPIWVSALAVSLACLILFTIGVLILTASRGSWIALGMTCFAMLMLVVHKSRAGLLGITLASFSLVIIGIFYLGPRPLMNLATGESSQERIEIWSRALYAIQDFPFTGLGMNIFRKVVHVRYPLTLIPPGVDVAHAHNEFLQAALDLGLPGLIAFVTLYLGAFWMLTRVWQEAGNVVADVPHTPEPLLAFTRPRTVRAMVIGLGGGLVAHLLFGLTDAIALGAKPGFLFWMLLGLTAALYEQIHAR